MKEAALEPGLKEREHRENTPGAGFGFRVGPEALQEKPNVSLGLRKALEQGLKQEVTAGAPGVS